MDEAILRRLPRAFEVNLADARQREEILSVVLGNEHVDETLRRGAPRSQLGALAAKLEGYSGSDMQDLCKQAALLPIHDFIEEERRRGFVPEGPRCGPGPAAPGARIVERGGEESRRERATSRRCVCDLNIAEGTDWRATVDAVSSIPRLPGALLQAAHCRRHLVRSRVQPACGGGGAKVPRGGCAVEARPGDGGAGGDWGDGRGRRPDCAADVSAAGGHGAGAGAGQRKGGAWEPRR